MNAPLMVLVLVLAIAAFALFVTGLTSKKRSTRARIVLVVAGLCVFGGAGGIVSLAQAPANNDAKLLAADPMIQGALADEQTANTMVNGFPDAATTTRNFVQQPAAAPWAVALVDFDHTHGTASLLAYSEGKHLNKGSLASLQTLVVVYKLELQSAFFTPVNAKTGDPTGGDARQLRQYQYRIFFKDVPSQTISWVDDMAGPSLPSSVDPTGHGPDGKKYTGTISNDDLLSYINVRLQS